MNNRFIQYVCANKILRELGEDYSYFPVCVTFSFKLKSMYDIDDFYFHRHKTPLKGMPESIQKIIQSYPNILYQSYYSEWDEPIKIKIDIAEAKKLKELVFYELQKSKTKFKKDKQSK